MKSRQHIYQLFATLLKYPTTAIKQEAEVCYRLLAKQYPAAGEIFSEFRAWAWQAELTEMEEVYTCTFDLQGICCPYIGHYLFGDNYQRSWFMAKLNEGYHTRGFSSGVELPDHIAVTLHFLEQGDEDEFCQVLLQEGLMPAMEKMIHMFDESGHHPYGQLLKSLGMWLSDGTANETKVLAQTGVGG